MAPLSPPFPSNNPSSPRNSSPHNPRILNRSKSSPVFDTKEAPDNQLFDRNFPSLSRAPKGILKKKTSQSDFFQHEQNSNWQQQRMAQQRRGSNPSSPAVLPAPSTTGPSHSLSISAPASPVTTHQPPSLSPTSSIVGQTMAMAISAAATPAPAQPVPSSPLPVVQDELEKLRGLVPSAKLQTRRPELTRKGSRDIKYKKAALNGSQQLKKAISEPVLQHMPPPRMKPPGVHPAFLIKEEKDKAAAINRTSFFMDVLKQDRNPQVVQEDINTSAELLPPSDESPRTSDLTSQNTALSSTSTASNPPPTTTTHESNNNNHWDDVSQEDEEKFLRGLGWVPDEELHVPELDALEIAAGKKDLLHKKVDETIPSVRTAAVE